jgi:hypothetical protein
MKWGKTKRDEGNERGAAEIDGRDGRYDRVERGWAGLVNGG